MKENAFEVKQNFDRKQKKFKTSHPHILKELCVGGEYIES